MEAVKPDIPINCLYTKDYVVLPNPLSKKIQFKDSGFGLKSNVFLFKNMEYVQEYMHWITIKSFSLCYKKSYELQCIHILNKNSKDSSKIILFSQCLYTNLGTFLPYLLDMCNYLRVNIISYEYNDKDDESSCIKDANVLFCYLNKLETISEIIPIGFSEGNVFNFSTFRNMENAKKIKATVMISPSWVYDSTSLKTTFRHENKELSNSLNELMKKFNEKNVRVFVIHGKKDTVVKYFLSVGLCYMLNNGFEWYPNEGAHYNLLEKFRNKLLMRLKVFIESEYKKVIEVKEGKEKKGSVHSKRKEPLTAIKEEKEEPNNIINENNNINNEEEQNNITNENNTNNTEEEEHGDSFENENIEEVRASIQNMDIFRESFRVNEKEIEEKMRDTAFFMESNNIVEKKKETKSKRKGKKDDGMEEELKVGGNNSDGSFVELDYNEEFGEEENMEYGDISKIENNECIITTKSIIIKEDIQKTVSFAQGDIVPHVEEQNEIKNEFSFSEKSINK